MFPAGVAAAAPELVCLRRETDSRSRDAGFLLSDGCSRECAQRNACEVRSMFELIGSLLHGAIDEKRLKKQVKVPALCREERRPSSCFEVTGKENGTDLIN